MKKKFLALVMTLSMVLSMVPMTALAAEDGTATATQEGQSVGAVATGNSSEGDAGTSDTPNDNPTPGGNDTGDSGDENTSGNDADDSTNPDANGGNDASNNEGEAGSEGEGSGETGNEGDSGDSNIEYPKETCTVEYKQQSDSVEFSGYEKISKYKYKLTYVIHAGADKSITIDLQRGVLNTLNNIGLVPGVKYEFEFIIKNESGREYQYKDQSFVLGPDDTGKFASIEDGTMLPVLTYDGQLLPKRFVGALLPEYFYRDIFGVGRSGDVTFEMLCQIYNKLAEKGYSGKTAISDYLLKYFNEQKNKNYETLTEMFEKEPYWADGVTSTANGIFTMTQQELDNYIANYQWIEPYIYATENRDSTKLDVQIKWPEPEIAAVSYNAFYTGLFSIVYGEDNIATLNTSSAGCEFFASHAVGDYQDDTTLYKSTDTYFQGLTEEGIKPDSNLSFVSCFALSGPGIGNSYQYYPFSYYNVIELEEKPLPDPIGPGDANAHAKSKTATSLVKQSDGTYNSEVTLTFPAQAVQERPEIQVAEADKEYLPADMIKAGSKVVDEIGGNEKGDYKDDKGNAYNFNFVNKADSIKMTVAGESYNAALAETPETGDTATYYFGTKDEGEETYPYVLHYYQNGTTFEDKGFGECFVWDINRNITCPDMVSLTYTVNLTNPQTSSGTYGNLDTNNCAILYPANRGTPEYYERPKVSYTVSRGGHRPSNPTVTIPDDVPTGLDLKNHYGYIIGYPVDYYTGKPTTDQTKKPVRPEGKITRAEVATIYFRMLTDENRAANWNQVSGFSDVKRSAWYNNAISTLTKAGILKGYEDGTFQPDGYITRAEFATIAIRFFSGVYEGEDLFPDIKGHWAEDYINNAANKGLVKGYEDGTFGPDRYITRAEAVTLVNRTLNRHPHNDGLHQDMLRWPDNMDTSKWYYADMQEATNSHEPDKNKSTADKEYWGKMLPIRDWEALEKEWSNANSAPGEGEVV